MISTGAAQIVQWRMEKKCIGHTPRATAPAAIRVREPIARPTVAGRARLHSTQPSNPAAASRVLSESGITTVWWARPGPLPSNTTRAASQRPAGSSSRNRVIDPPRPESPSYPARADSRSRPSPRPPPTGCAHSPAVRGAPARQRRGRSPGRRLSPRPARRFHRSSRGRRSDWLWRAVRHGVAQCLLDGRDERFGDLRWHHQTPGNGALECRSGCLRGLPKAVGQRPAMRDLANTSVVEKVQGLLRRHPNAERRITSAVGRHPRRRPGP